MREVDEKTKEKVRAFLDRMENDPEFRKKYEHVKPIVIYENIEQVPKERIKQAKKIENDSTDTPKESNWIGGVFFVFIMLLALGLSILFLPLQIVIIKFFAGLLITIAVVLIIVTVFKNL